VMITRSVNLSASKPLANRARCGRVLPLSLVFCCSVLFASCQTSLLERFGMTSESGRPLLNFSARDGVYFPPFIEKFFRGALLYEKEFPNLASARSGMQMIEVKQLNDDGRPLNEANLSWSADGVYLGFEVVSNAQRKILLKDLVGDFARELMILPRGRANNFVDGLSSSGPSSRGSSTSSFGGNTSWNAGLRWSRDSTRYAFMSNGGVGQFSIYVGAVGGNERPLARSDAKDGFATWSPKTNEIAFVSARSGNGDIYVVDLAADKPLRLTTSTDMDIFPDWSPDARRLVYVSGDAFNHDIEFVERTSASGLSKWTKPRRVTNSQRDELRPIISPDGRWLAFYRDDGTIVEGNSPRWNLHVIPFGSESDKEIESPLDDRALDGTVVARDVVIDLNAGPAWTPDSRKLIFVKRDPQSFNPIHGYDLFTGQSYMFRTNTRMNRDILVSKLGVLSFRAQVGAWDRVFVALTNQGLQLQNQTMPESRINYL